MTQNSIPRPEYPRPQFVRENWLNLNGAWQFEIDAGDSGIHRGLKDKKLSGEILVPFCPESKLSGVEYVDFMPAVWYRREVKIPAAWKKYPRLRLHFQACDYETTVWVNGSEVARHRGGFTPFFAEIGHLVKPGGKAQIVVRARDDNRIAKASGKQSNSYGNAGCHYTRTTGIWQTVWLEPLPETAMERPRITPELGNLRFHVEIPLSGPTAGKRVTAILKDSKGEIVRTEVAADSDFSAMLDLPIPEKRLKLWGPGKPNLYDIIFELRDSEGNLVDSLTSYAGMRSIVIDGFAVKINGVSVFQRQVLDQGYYPDGLMTAPTDAALVKDIKLALDAGFNSARLHEKVFEERFLYHADRLGYPVWAEFADWGVRHRHEFSNPVEHQPMASLMAQWQEALIRDYSHPSIIGWCPLNETAHNIGDAPEAMDDLTHGLYYATKACDRTRPVIDASGYSHRVTGADIYDSHHYEQNVEKFRADHAGLAEGKPFINSYGEGNIWNIPYGGQPYFCSEFGGIWWSPEAKKDEDSWGYGIRPKTLEEFYARFEGLCGVLLENPRMFGYCYTQLTDVFQEQNGIYTFDRRKKFDMKRIRAAQTRKAAIE
ncbi:MAG: beta-galactosidase [Lentisphaerae bacterium]|jgi:beta-galactosidase/beta-glucuronidase|nr:beta-galactosidase [Lentisphaerota bacterium]